MMVLGSFNILEKGYDVLSYVEDPKKFLVRSLATLSTESPQRFLPTIQKYVNQVNQSVLWIFGHTFYRISSEVFANHPKICKPSEPKCSSSVLYNSQGQYYIGTASRIHLVHFCVGLVYELKYGTTSKILPVHL
jgi:hypothetical protein